ncbi:hypothetical protein HU200_026393 [Digitaria exilis]|uniref:No apical meristem-associated C-terminal domain-containing protein n=1 Tax=Digitaria exilis TaxID=1010633 RepID=A0A835BZ41_9POAL|nr:hypothetical protein HU200_026393 [Digitaria exilis]
MKLSFLLAREVDSTPPGGLLNFLNKNTPKHGPSQVVINGSSSQPINVADDKSSYCPRIEKRLMWTKDEDIILVGAWVNNSNDPIHANYKKNDQYWKEVTAAYNSAIPKKRYGPFMFKHCWDVLRKEPKWDAYLERLANLDPEMRKFNLEDNVGQPYSVDGDDKEERPIGGKKAKELQKRTRKDQACVIDLEDELQLFLEAQKKANKGCNKMLETQRRVSSENLESPKLA